MNHKALRIKRKSETTAILLMQIDSSILKCLSDKIECLQIWYICDLYLSSSNSIEDARKKNNWKLCVTLNYAFQQYNTKLWQFSRVSVCIGVINCSDYCVLLSRLTRLSARSALTHYTQYISRAQWRVCTYPSSAEKINTFRVQKLWNGLMVN